MTLLDRLNRLSFWAAWPVFYFYFPRTIRTRVLVIYQGKLLVTKNWISPGTWGLPGGGIKKDETPAESASRELFEETGILMLPNELRYIGTANFNRFKLRYPVECFMVSLKKSVMLKKQFIEVYDIDWKSISELRKTDVGEDVLKVLNLYKKATR